MNIHSSRSMAGLGNWRQNHGGGASRSTFENGEQNNNLGTSSGPWTIHMNVRGYSMKSFRGMTMKSINELAKSKASLLRRNLRASPLGIAHIYHCSSLLFNTVHCPYPVHIWTRYPKTRKGKKDLPIWQNNRKKLEKRGALPDTTFSENQRERLICFGANHISWDTI